MHWRLNVVTGLICNASSDAKASSSKLSMHANDTCKLIPAITSNEEKGSEGLRKKTIRPLVMQSAETSSIRFVSILSLQFAY